MEDPHADEPILFMSNTQVNKSLNKQTICSLIYKKKKTTDKQKKPITSNRTTHLNVMPRQTVICDGGPH